MRNWFRDILFSEHDQDPRFVALVQTTLGISTVAALAFFVTLVFSIKPGDPLATIIIVGFIGVLALVFLFMARRSILWPGKLFLPIAMVVGIPFIATQSKGIYDSSVSLYPVIILIAVLLLGQRIIPWITGIALLGIWSITYYDMIRFNNSIIASRPEFIDIVNLSLAQIIAAAALHGLMTRLNRALSQSRKNENTQIATNEELIQLQLTLEKSVEERTAELEIANLKNERRAQQFEAIALVSGAITLIRSLDELLPRITELISKQFDYYHVGIFLNDANDEYTVLSAANSEGGLRMLQRGHQLKIGQEGIVGYATSTGKPRIALDVGEDAVYFNNPHLPDTHSEIALPLKVEDVIVGALDVQSKKEAAFQEEDINVLSLLASQVSLAIENARLFDQARKSLAESDSLYRQYIQEAWGRLPKEQNLAGYRYNARGSAPIEKRVSAKSRAAKDEVKTEVQDRPKVSVPIKIRGETIGMLFVKTPDENNINDDQMALVNAVAERVALSAENARLFEETNRRAERERLVSDITVKIRSTNDPDDMIQIALNELKTALGATNVELVPHTLKDIDRIAKLASSTDTQPIQNNKKKSGERE